jgi:murein DD-endopeptidase MepM/ murein hydrolase activator NlpD
MFGRRYTVLIADRSTGFVRRLTVSVRQVATVTTGILALPILIGLGAKWSASTEISQLRAENNSLAVENTNYRTTTGALTSQIQSLGQVVEDLGARAELDPAQARAIESLPALVRARAAGGTAQANALVSNVIGSSMTSPEDTFGVLRTLLQALESRLSYVRRDVERQEALAAATPSIWPAFGWLTSTFGSRSDPMTGEPAFHQGLDISTAKGQPIFATANGIVESAAYTGEYGNLIVIRHDFGLTTRYGHLSRFNVKPNAAVRRGDVIGFVGSTGRSTGSHLHYEILANGKLLDPLRMLTQPARRTRAD